MRECGSCRAGDEYYAWALSAGTTTRMTPEQIHQLGQEELRALQSEMDGILKGSGHDVRERVGERMTALGKQARFLFPDNDKVASRSWRCCTIALPIFARDCRERS